MFLRKKPKATPRATAAKDRSVRSFFLPILLVTLLMLTLVCIAGRWIALHNNQEQILQGLAATAASVAKLSEARIEGEQTILKLLAQDAELLEALQAKQDISQIQNRLKQQLPAADALMVVSANMDEDRLLQTLQGSYLALDLHNRVLKTAAIPPVEASKTANDNTFTTVVPVTQKGQVLGTLFARYDMDLIASPLQHLQLNNGMIGLEQVIDGSHFVLAGSTGFRAETANATEAVKNTLWQIKYGLTSSTGMIDLLLLLGLVVIAGLVIYLVLNKQQAKLAHALKTDMGTAVSIMDATLKRSGTPAVKPQITESASALEVLSKYAKATFTAAKAAGNKAGLPMHQAAEVLEQSVTQPVAELSAEIFLANDIRGIHGQTLTPSMAQQLGQAVGTLALNAGETSVLIGRDARLSSEEYASALTAGVLASGCDVLDLGLVPVPLLYFAGQVLTSRSCVMVTGGHNPPQYNGFKIILDGKPLLGDELLALKKMIESGGLRSGTGELETRDVSGEYVRQVTGDVQLAEPRKVVVDGGNGVGGRLLVRLLQGMGCEVVELFCDPDGEFPNHFPDPALSENLSALALEVLAQGADFGVALDGDGDRLALVDEQGEQVATDLLIMLLAADIIRRHPGADVIYDVKSSSYLASYILSNGGRPVMWKTGHGLMKLRMLETEALLGGEYAGHLYIKDRWFGFDDAMYAAVRLLELFSMESQPVSTFFAPLPKAVGSTVLELEMPRQQAESLLQDLTQQLDTKDMDVIDMDGLRFEYSDGWALIRLSNTLPHLVFRFEGKDQVALENAKSRLRSQIQKVLPELVLPF